MHPLTLESFQKKFPETHAHEERKIGSISRGPPNEVRVEIGLILSRDRSETQALWPTGTLLDGWLRDWSACGSWPPHYS